MSTAEELRAQGMNNREIARELGVHPQTVGRRLGRLREIPMGDTVAIKAREMWLAGVCWKTISRELGYSISALTKRSRTVVTPVAQMPVDMLRYDATVGTLSLRDGLLAAILAARIHRTDEAVRRTAARMLYKVKPECVLHMGMLLTSRNPYELINTIIQDIDQ